MTASFSSIFGSTLIQLSLLAALASVACSIAGIRLKSTQWLQSAYLSHYLTFGFLSLASVVMLSALTSNDFSIAYVQQSIDVKMSWYYKLAAFWGGLDGSILFWAWLLSLFGSITLKQNRNKHADLLPYVSAILMLILIFFLLILSLYKQPFAPFLPYKPLDGKGINPLLRDFYMTIHPPSLYIGYVSASVPFAFGLSALITGNLDNAWLKSVRKWMLLCWYFLSQGLFLGALWAYHVLNWGGFWGWDPVENAGLLPWFTATAFLHSTIIQERLGMMKLWNLVLVIVTFLLTITGTFLTRSGVVQSQHAFGDDPSLAVSFLVFLGLIAIVSIGLIVYRLHILRSKTYISSWLSREFTFLLNNWILLGCAFFVLTATLFPALSKWLTHETLSVGQPFYNRWMGPIGIVLLLLAAVSPLFSWKKSPLQWLFRQLRLPVLGGIAITGLLYWKVPWTRALSPVFTEHLQWPVGLTCLLVSFISILGIFQEFFIGIRARKKAHAESILQSFFGLIQKNQRRYGGYFVHVGIALMFIGFAGQSYKKEKEVQLTPMGSVTFERYKLQYEGIQTSNDHEKTIITAKINVYLASTQQMLFVLLPAKWIYFGKEEEPRTIIAKESILAEELYVFFKAIHKIPESEAYSINLQLTTNPLIHWLWFGFVWLLLGTLIAFFPLKRNASMQSWVGIVILGFLLTNQSMTKTALGDSSNERHTEQTKLISPPKNIREQQLFKKLACLCGGCARLPLADCACNHAGKEREHITQLIALSKSDEEIFSDFEQRYKGQSPLIESRNPHLKWVYLFPLGVFVLLGVGLFQAALRKKKGEILSAKEPQATNESLDGQLERYRKQLEEDLASEDSK